MPRTTRPARGGTIVGDRGRRVATLLDLQQSAGNGAVAQLLKAYGGATDVSLHGKTWGYFDGGTSTVSRVKARNATGCECTGDDSCFEVTGLLKVDYHVDVTIEMPEVPSGLNKCQERRVRDSSGTCSGRTSASTRGGSAPTTAPRCDPSRRRTAGRRRRSPPPRPRRTRCTTPRRRPTLRRRDASSLAIDPFNRTTDLDC